MKNKSILALAIVSSLSMSGAASAMGAPSPEQSMEDTAVSDFEVVFEGDHDDGSIGVKVKRVTHLDLTSQKLVKDKDDEELRNFEVIFEGESSNPSVGVKVKRVGYLNLNITNDNP